MPNREESNARRRYVTQVRKRLFAINVADEDDFYDLIDEPYPASDLVEALKYINKAAEAYLDGDTTEAWQYWMIARALYPDLPDWFYYYHPARE